MIVRSQTIHRGTLPGSAIGASIKVAACEAVGIQPDHPGARLRGFRFLRGSEITSGADYPDVEFDLAVRDPEYGGPDVRCA